MIKRRGVVLLQFLGMILLLVALTHTAFHFLFFGTGISSFGERGISGLAIGPISFDDSAKQEYFNLSPFSRGVIIIEWVAIIFILVFAFVKNKMNVKKEVIDLNLKERYTKSKTDLDVLYDVLKEKKHLRISTVSKAFSIDRETAMEWCQILESGNLASIEYPTFGDAEVKINEKA